MRLLQIYDKYVINYSSELQILVKEIPNDCLYDTKYIQMYVADCHLLEVGGRVGVVLGSGTGESQYRVHQKISPSTLVTMIDKHFKNAKRLNVTAVSPYQYNWTSPKDWFLFIEEMIYTSVLAAKLKIDQNIPYNSAWLVSNSVLGYVAPIPDAYKQSLNILGIQHVIAVSGFHISFFVMLISDVFPKQIPRLGKLLTLCLFILLFWIAVGFQPSVNRAVSMSLVILILKETCFLQVRPFRLLAFVAAIWLMIDPLIVISVSFQLSYLATLGILTFFGEEEDNTIAKLEGNIDTGGTYSGLKNILRDSFRVSLVAQLYTFGVLWYYFQQYPLLSLGANTLLFWLPPGLIIIGTLAFCLLLLTAAPVELLQVIGYIGLSTIISLPLELLTQLLLVAEPYLDTIINLSVLPSKAYAGILFILFVSTYIKVQHLRNKKYKNLDMRVVGANV